MIWREARLILLHRRQQLIDARSDIVTSQMHSVRNVLHTLNTTRGWARGFSHPSGYASDIRLGLNAWNDTRRGLVEYLRDEFNKASQSLQQSLLVAYMQILLRSIWQWLCEHRETPRPLKKSNVETVQRSSWLVGRLKQRIFMSIASTQRARICKDGLPPINLRPWRLTGSTDPFYHQ